MDLGVTNSHFSSSVVLMWQESHWNLLGGRLWGFLYSLFGLAIAYM